MNPFEDLCTDTIYIRHQDQRATGPLKASFGKGKFTVFDETLDVSEGDLIERPLPNGKAERYDIVDVEFSQGLHDIPPSYSLQVHKHGSLVPFQKPGTTNITITNSKGVQVGDHNSQSIVDSFKQVIEQIENGPGTPEEKEEAKSRLKKFLKHPLVSAAIGPALTAFLGVQ